MTFMGVWRALLKISTFWAQRTLLCLFSRCLMLQLCFIESTLLDLRGGFELFFLWRLVQCLLFMSCLMTPSSGQGMLREWWVTTDHGGCRLVEGHPKPAVCRNELYFRSLRIHNDSGTTWALRHWQGIRQAFYDRYCVDCAVSVSVISAKLIVWF